MNVILVISSPQKFPCHHKTTLNRLYLRQLGNTTDVKNQSYLQFFSRDKILDINIYKRVWYE